MEKTLKNSIDQQRRILEHILAQPLAKIALRCQAAWPDRVALNKVLLGALDQVPHCTFLYALDTQGIQISDNVSASGLLTEHFARDRSQRPYMNEVVPVSGFLLSEAYISLRASRPSLTALQLVRRGEEVLGFIGADFDLRDLPVTAHSYDEPMAWRQIRGDAAIRGTLFQQTRVDSLLDKDIDLALSVLAELFEYRGVFQCVLHFSSSRATIWLLDNPFVYRILQHEVLSDPDVCLAYPQQAYAKDAIIPATAIGEILQTMKKLRFADDTVYLRSASINIFNGLVSLTFSCDGSHYMRYDEFIEKNLDFWVGS